MDTAEVVLCALVVLIMAVSLLSNVLVLVCFLYNPEIRRPAPGLFTLNLTFCNLLLTVCSMPLMLAGLWAAGAGGPRRLPDGGFLETFLSTNSMLSMAALSIDRWVAVVFPLRCGTRDAACVLGYTWVHSMAFSTVATCLSWVGYHKLYASCTLANGRAGSRTQFVIFTLLSTPSPFCLLCFTYLKVLKAACDPFVYSLLRHQYRETCSDIINRLLKNRSSQNATGPSAATATAAAAAAATARQNQGNCIPSVE
ncbi:hypothetical protein CRUP_023451 [Coryphaenoides rupestris]|nr:hypothetical protein CRUP_023451 [Coryphaenoides rupestris]